MDMLKILADYAYGQQQYQIGNYTVNIQEKLSEGGYAYVYKCVDINTNKEYALKKILCQDQERYRMAQREVEVMRAIPENDNIVRFYDSTVITEGKTRSVLLLLELCTEGTLINLLEKYNGQLSLPQILYIIKEILTAVQVVHRAGFIHRDLKVENILLHNKKFKLCDFGSCTSEIIELSTASRNDLLSYQETFERETTLMYRPPEMIDLYARHRIDFKADVWMIGCILYTLAFFRHPFQDQAQLAIVNAHYSFPQGSRFNNKFHSFIAWILNPIPALRPSVDELINAIENYESVGNFGNSAPQQSQAKNVRKREDRDMTDEEIQREIMKIRNQGAQPKPRPKVDTRQNQPQNIWSAPASVQVTQQTQQQTVENANLLGFSPPKGSNNAGWAKF
ncbi:unnamed protein product [Blepharisma stoltei]|uniref:non-specific serine/threonine protein kinase n=1 Tax=Blepharisma stoltei TaxID=1481888 RepID=A0AAU9IBF4_9CILI|nr:unnamed protein product [Blepharisma stoltei]